MKLSEIPVFVTSLAAMFLLSGVEPPPAYADFTFGDLKNLGPLMNTSMVESPFWFTPDSLSLWFGRYLNAGATAELLVVTRPAKDGPWGTPASLGMWGDDSASVLKTVGVVPGYTTADGLEMYMGEDRPGGYGDIDLWMWKREAIDAGWSDPVNLGPVVNSPAGEARPTISMDGLELYFSNREGAPRPGTYGSADLWVTKRATRNDPWGTPVNLGPTINTPYREHFPHLSANGLSLVFYSNRPGGYGQGDLYMTRRASRSETWGPPVNLGPLVNSVGWETDGFVSADGSTFVFDSTRPGGYGDYDIWQVSVLPIVDFNGDGKVDGKEVLAMAQHWGQNKSLYDIGLSPLGDGVVDANDLTVLAGYVGQEVNDPSLIAHWALDETEGMAAIDSAGDNDAMVLGGVAWQVDGKMGGALAFDGKDDFARSGKSVLDPAAGPFSVIAWVKGGAPGRVIVSQAAGADWLYLNQYGMLTTDLKSAGREGKPLTSSAFTLDDQWHRVVLTWDGTNRTLQMDGVEVAGDTQPNLAPSNGSLHIGGGKNLGPTSFWSGLIDDVRIYNRAVQP